ncbi:MAG: DUF429 domain-containing protein [Maricaulaceae bacterium]
MKSVLVISSDVASSPVGAGPARLLWPRLGIEPIVASTVNYGRHPGWGAPGGGATPNVRLESLLDALEAQGVYARLDGVLTGYFANAPQVGIAAKAIRTIKAANPQAPIWVDPIMGDAETGLYVNLAVARAICAELLPLADVITPNAWELGWITQNGGPEGGPLPPEAVDRPCLVSSVAQGERTGALWRTDAGAWLTDHPVRHRPPRGVGDLLTALMLAEALNGARPSHALGRSVAGVLAAIDAALEGRSPELPLIAAQDAILNPEPLVCRRLAPAEETWVAGLDGRPGGWVMALREVGGRAPPRLRLIETVTEALDAPEAPLVIGVDMPIAFPDIPEPGGRACERAARAALGPRKSSVFPAPCREALQLEDYAQAMAVNRAKGGPGLTKQAFNIFPKMRELDVLMTPDLQARVREVHPELAFTVLAGAPMAHPKRTPEGRAERLAILEAAGWPRDALDPSPFARTEAAGDDVLDACVVACSAQRIWADAHTVWPEGAVPLDPRGLRMEIVA